MVSSTRIAKNTISLSLSLIGRKLISFIYLALIARYTGANTTGLYYLLISISALFTSLMDFGLSQVFIRDASQETNKAGSLLNSVFSLKLILCLLGTTSAVILINILNYPYITKQLIYLVIVMMVLDSFTGTFYSCLRIRHLIKYESRGLVIGHLITLVLGSFFVWQQYSLYFLILAVLANKLFNFLNSFYFALIKSDLIPSFHFDYGLSAQLLKTAFPFLVAIFLNDLVYIDVFLLSYLKKDSETIALFGISSTIIQSFMFIPLALSSATYPAMSSFYNQTDTKMSRIFNHSCEALLLFIIPATVGIAILAPDIIRFFFGVSYDGAILPLQILIFSLIPSFLHYPIEVMLNATHRQVTNMIQMLASVFVHLGLSYILIPKFNVTGICLSILLGAILLFSLGGVTIKKIPDLNLNFFGEHFGHMVAASAFMGLCLFFLNFKLHFLLTIPLGAAIYVVSFMFFQGYSSKGFDKVKALAVWNQYKNHHFNMR